MPKMSEQEVRHFVVKFSNSAPEDFGLQAALPELVAAISSASASMSELDLARFLGAVGIVYRVATWMVFADLEAEAAKARKN